MSPERDFAVLDRYLREKLNAQLIALEVMILFTHNKTSLWMAQLSSCEREELFQAARKLAPAFKEKFKGRREEIEQKRRHEMEKRIEENAHKELKVAQEKEKLTIEIQEYGCMGTRREEVDNGLELCETQKKRKF